MKFELRTLDSYEDIDLINEIKRVSEIVNGRLTMSKFDEHSRVHSSTVRNRFNGWGKALTTAGISSNISAQARAVTKSEIIELAKKIAQENETEYLTCKQFTKHTDIGQKAILTRFGSWKEVLKIAGLKTVPLGKRYTEEECYENILNLWVHYGRQPNYAELKQHPSKVGPKAYVGRWRSWRKALSSFIEYTSKEDETQNVHLENDTLSEQKADDIPNKKKGKSKSINLSTRYKVLVRDKFKWVP